MVNEDVTITRSLVEGIYIIREGEFYWMVNDDGVGYFTGTVRPELPEIMALVQRTLADRYEEQ